jgi:hypothetical protein
VAQLYPRALGSLFVASYDSQGYGGGILTRLHTGTPDLEYKHKVKQSALGSSPKAVLFTALKLVEHDPLLSLKLIFNWS